MTVFTVSLESLIRKSQELAKQSNIKAALGAHRRAKEVYPAVKTSSESWNSLCWFGSLGGYAKEVMNACDRGVELDMSIRDSRGWHAR